MKYTSQIYLDFLTERFGKEDVIRKMDAKGGGPPVCVFFYYNLPEEGYLTAITYGLSVVNYPEWKYGQPELVVMLETQDESWGLAAAFFAAQFRSQMSFSYGSLFTLAELICEESEMVGYFVFAPPFLEKSDSTIVLPDYLINLYGMYPLYQEEVQLYQEIDLAKF